jgi:DNA-binding transcriptional MerR regulator
VFKIGEFSRIARVSARLLRFYDELGLLKPGVVDATTGYRFYTTAQLQRLNRILVLKDLGLSLEQIGGVIDEDASADQLRAMLLVPSVRWRKSPRV